MRHLLDNPRNPAEMTPSQRRCEIAAILAGGVLRLRQCRETRPAPDVPRTAEKDSKSAESGLDEVAASSPHVLAVNDGENQEELEVWG